MATEPGSRKMVLSEYGVLPDTDIFGVVAPLHITVAVRGNIATVAPD
ncbi:hypothetical protein P244_0708 [Klebsiella pneumoniae HK787]|nr:hypothetical protein P244_0708 [Klebsiella pneumoniae HK787]